MAVSWPQKIRDIQIYENRKTKDEVVLELAGVAIDTDFTPADIDKIRVKLIHSQLFSDVDVSYEWVGHGIRLHILARDRIAWFAVPAFSAAKNNVGGGVIAGHMNIAGRNKRLLFYGAYFTADSRALVVYQDPSIFGSRFYTRIDGGLSRLKLNEFNLDLSRPDNISEPQLFRQSPVWKVGGGVQLGVALPYHLFTDVYYRAQAIRYERACLNQQCSDNSIAPESPFLQLGRDPSDPPSPDGTHVYAQLQGGYDSIVNLYTIQQGTALIGWYELSHSAIGSDFEYQKVGFRFKRAIRLFREHNLVLRGSFQAGFDLPFHEELEGGGTELRGFVSRQFRGDTSVEGHIEHYIPLFWAWSTAFRGVVFYDSEALWFRHINGTLTPDGMYRVDRSDGTYRSFLPEVDANGRMHAPSTGFDRDHWHNTIGTGLRLFLKNICIPVFGFDIGYGLEANAVRFFVAVGGAGQ